MSDAYARGRRMGVDVGLVRVGVALCDPDGILATPLTTLRRDPDPRKGFDVKLLAGLVQEHDVVAVYVGLPRSLDGGENASTAMARDYAEALVRRLRVKGRDVPVRLVDERLSTVDAHRALLEAGVARRDHMDKVDQVAAATILQSAVDRAGRSPRGRGARWWRWSRRGPGSRGCGRRGRSRPPISPSCRKPRGSRSPGRPRALLCRSRPGPRTGSSAQSPAWPYAPRSRHW